MSHATIAEKKRRTRKDYVYHLEYRTRWSDNDMYSHMNNPVYGQLFDSIINTYLIEQCGLRTSLEAAEATSTPASAQLGIVASTYCDYFASVAFPDLLDLGLRVARLGKSSVTYEVGVFKRGAEDVKAVGGFTHVFVMREGMRPAVPGRADEGDGKGGMEERIRRGLEKLVVDGSATPKL